MNIEIINGGFTICKVADYSQVKLDDEYIFVGRTDGENSLICPTDKVPANTTKRIDGWRALRLQGVLDFSLIGVLSKLLGVLAREKIGIAAVSTYNTDYIFVKDNDFERAINALQDAGYIIK